MTKKFNFLFFFQELFLEKLSVLCADDLRELGMPVGQQVRVLTAIRELHTPDLLHIGIHIFFLCIYIFRFFLFIFIIIHYHHFFHTTNNNYSQLIIFHLF